MVVNVEPIDVHNYLYSKYHPLCWILVGRTYLKFLVIAPVEIQYLKLNSNLSQKYVLADYMN